MLLRGTQKFLKELGLKKIDVTRYPKQEHPLDEWYAHFFTLYPRRKCVVFAHAGTMFSFFALDVKKADLANLGVFFCKRLSKALNDENYPSKVIEVFISRAKEIRITSTIDRVMIGTVNRIVLDLGFFGEETERTMFRNESVMGAYFRRGSYMAFPGWPLQRMRNILLGLDELQGTEIQEPLSAKMIGKQLKVDSIYS